MRGRIYAVPFDGVSWPATNALDVWELTAADDKPIAVVGWTLGPSGGVADAGDAAEEHLRLVWLRGYTTSGSGGTATTPTKPNPNTADPGFTAETNNTTVATTGTIVDLFPFGWNMRGEYEKWLPEGTELVTNQAANLLVCRLITGPADALLVSGVCYIEEI